jgi:hypothetical protein
MRTIAKVYLVCVLSVIFLSIDATLNFLQYAASTVCESICIV